MKARLFFGVAILLGLVAGAHAAVLTVVNTNDNAAGSLRQAIQDASPGDTIVFQIPTSNPGYNASTGVTTITLTSAELTINKNLAIDGAGAKIVVQRNNASGAAQFSIFNITAGAVAISKLTIASGQAIGATSGGGIQNAGVLMLTDCTLRGNNGNSGAVNVLAGATATVTNCTIQGNSALSGAGIRNSGTLTLTLSTITGNGAAGGGVGGVLNSGVARVRSSIIAGNTGGGSASDVSGAFMSEGYNIIGTSFGSSGFGVTGDQIGASVAQVNLSQLQDNGGPTQTMRPRPGSVAIDQGNRGTDANGQPINTDQRGYPRPIDLPTPNAVGGDGSDIGAVEVGAAQSGPNFTVTNLETGDDGSCTTDHCTFHEALVAANANADANTITFASGVTGTIFIFPFTITNPLTITGPGARLLTISADTFLGGRIFQVISSNIVITGLTITNGIVFNTNGGAISNLGGLTMQDCTISASSANGNDPSGFGGAIYNGAGASLTLTRCTIRNCNATSYGGGVYSDGNVTATNCTFTANIGLRGGGIISRAVGGAAIMTLLNCTFTNNSATDGVNSPGFGGGGVYAEGGALQHFMANCIIAGNGSTNDPDVRGQYTSDGNNLIGTGGDSTGFTNGVNGDLVGTNGSPVDAQYGMFGNNGGQTDTWPLLNTSPAIDAGNNANAPTTDQRGYSRNGVSDIGAFEFGATTTPSKLANISTRLRVEGGDNVPIAGFIVTGTAPKRVIVRALGPSLNVMGVPVVGRVPDTTLELIGPGGQIALNDNWRTTQQAEIIASTVPPPNDLESAIIATLPASAGGIAYTAIVRGAGNATGVGQVEVYDLDNAAASQMANISTRGLVQTGDDVMIGGIILLGPNPQRVIVRALGPSLNVGGVPVAGRLGDTTLEIKDANGMTEGMNDNWRSTQEAEIIATTVPPPNDLESAIVATLPSSAGGTGHTAIVRGKNNTTGVGQVEVYALSN